MIKAIILFQFLRRDAMFELDEVVEQTAFFTRTGAAAFDSIGDGWQDQNYNRRPLLRYTWRDAIRKIAPARLRRTLAKGRSPCAPKILTPANGAIVAETGMVKGSVALAADSHLWVLVRRKDFDGWWPQGGGAAAVERTQWSVPVTYGGAQDAGFDFEIAALVVAPSTHELWTDWVARVKETGRFPPVPLPPARFVRGEAYRTVKRNQ